MFWLYITTCYISSLFDTKFSLKMLKEVKLGTVKHKIFWKLAKIFYIYPYEVENYPWNTFIIGWILLSMFSGIKNKQKKHRVRFYLQTCDIKCKPKSGFQCIFNGLERGPKVKYSNPPTALNIEPILMIFGLKFSIHRGAQRRNKKHAEIFLIQLFSIARSSQGHLKVNL